MNTRILFKLAVLLTVAVLGYGMFWFFKVGQIEKQIKNFVAANGVNISISDVSVSGFPMAQKITIKDLKFTIPNSLLNKRNVVAKEVVLVSKAFSSDFTVSFVEAPTLQDIEGNVANVEFSKDPEIKISFENNRISKLSYQDSGYRVTDLNKATIYAASSTSVNFEVKEENDGRIVGKITAAVKDSEGFGVLEVYKNAFEKGLIEGIKTGEIVVTKDASQQGDVLQLSVDASPSNNTVNSSNASQVNNAVIAPSSNSAQQVASSQSTNQQNGQNGQNVTNTDAATPQATQDKQEETVTSVPDSSLIKSNFALDMEYVLTPVKEENEEQSNQAAGELPKMQMAQDHQYSKVTKINNLEFSNPLYRVMVNGEFNSFLDDELPSGSIAIKIENVNNFLDYVKLTIDQMVTKLNQQPSVTQAQATVDSASQQPAANAEQAQIAANVNPQVAAANLDADYSNFLKRVSAGLVAITQEVAAKNPVSKDNVAQFDIRREKNLEFLVNETSLREILGKI